MLGPFYASAKWFLQIDPRSARLKPLPPPAVASSPHSSNPPPPDEPQIHAVAPESAARSSLPSAPAPRRPGWSRCAEEGDECGRPPGRLPSATTWVLQRLAAGTACWSCFAEGPIFWGLEMFACRKSHARVLLPGGIPCLLEMVGGTCRHV
ncbi:hypothetical protein PVAP13_3KG272881 [Panicum virgatum]|uniref:Uncharacterized protein n=1 Tax=Panicum virgatum TaxID=38727 RepID=A0A8T0V239_PANVG|nr:hypothetical protein PVAP13_3KG272881 [Panicum virgatum]